MDREKIADWLTEMEDEEESCPPLPDDCPYAEGDIGRGCKLCWADYLLSKVKDE